jgi:hypothetical protein
LEDEINVYYANNGETKIYTEGKKWDGTSNWYTNKKTSK